MGTFPVELAAYAAGFFDGEGCVTITKASRKTKGGMWGCRTIMCNTNRDVLDVLQGKFGGNVHKKKKIPGEKQAYNFTLAAGDAEAFLQAIAPYVLVKRGDVEVGLSFISTLKDRSKNEYLNSDERELREQLLIKCRVLHVRGEIAKEKVNA